jgi:hypothetical protein
MLTDLFCEGSEVVRDSKVVFGEKSQCHPHKAVRVRGSSIWSSRGGELKQKPGVVEREAVGCGVGEGREVKDW